MHSIIRELSEVTATPTAHGIGLKKVLLCSNETTSSVTQIAVTQLRKGESIEAHIHSTMDEHYIFLEGKAKMFLNGKEYTCKNGTYILVHLGTDHLLEALSDIRFITIGVAYDK